MTSRQRFREHAHPVPGPTSPIVAIWSRCSVAVVMTESPADSALMSESDEEHVQGVAQRLASEFGRDRGSVEARVRSAYDTWDDGRVRTFVPIMVERRVRQDLRRAS